MKECPMTRREAAVFLKAKYNLRVTENSLATMASRGGGPKMLKIGRYVYYRREDLVEWVASRCSGLLDSTSSASGEFPLNFPV